MKRLRILLLCCAMLLTLLPLTGCDPDAFGGQKNYKPVIYLYPTQKTEVSVQLDYAGTLTTTYPAYQEGWQVTAYPDGKLMDADGKEYSYLFWEGEDTTVYDFSSGFVVKGEDTAAFLQKILSAMGLLPKEYNEFIVFWLPQMQENPYNLITFQQEAYTEAAKLEITPQPDSLIRIFMAYKKLDAPIDLPEQALPTYSREGFTVVEWGGAYIS